MNPSLKVILVASVLLATACTNNQDPGQRAVAGGLLGAGSGAAIGALAGGGKGAAIGGLLGALGGAGTGYITTPKPQPYGRVSNTSNPDGMQFYRY